VLRAVPPAVLAAALIALAAGCATGPTSNQPGVLTLALAEERGT
jgi:type IV pilus biogenesis protein CpaD/CtpE